MARDQTPMTDEELAEFQEAMEKQGEELRESLAEDLGGDPRTIESGPSPMAANRPVSERELDRIPDRISRYFDRVRDLLADETATPEPTFEQWHNVNETDR